jgi:hypothetical protein
MLIMEEEGLCVGRIIGDVGDCILVIYLHHSSLLLIRYQGVSVLPQHISESIHLQTIGKSFAQK